MFIVLKVFTFPEEVFGNGYKFRKYIKNFVIYRTLIIYNFLKISFRTVFEQNVSFLQISFLHIELYEQNVFIKLKKQNSTLKL